MKESSLQKSIDKPDQENNNPDYAVDPAFIDLGVTAEHVDFALAVLENPDYYEVRYLRKAPMVRKHHNTEDEEKYKKAQNVFSQFYMERSPAYGCIISVFVDLLPPGIITELEFSEKERVDGLVGWSCSSENYVTSKHSIKLYAILRGLLDPPEVIETEKGKTYICGKNSKARPPEAVSDTLLKCVDRGFDWK